MAEQLSLSHSYADTTLQDRGKLQEWIVCGVRQQTLLGYCVLATAQCARSADAAVQYCKERCADQVVTPGQNYLV